MVVELHVNDLVQSLLFWREVLGFQTAFERAEERFTYLEHPEGHQIMLCQRHGRFETGPLDRPLGQGAMFQIYLEDIAPVLRALTARKWPRAYARASGPSKCCVENRNTGVRVHS